MLSLLTSLRRVFLMACFVLASFGGGAHASNLSVGWQLLGNPGSQPITLASVYGSAAAPVTGVSSNVLSIWMWDLATGKWSFYTPALADGGAAYAAAHNYNFLTQIPPGQGYWVNVSVATAVPSPYAGRYSGTYSGGDYGTWTATISSNGSFSGTAHSLYSGSTIFGTASLDVNGSLKVTFGSTSSGAYFVGAFDAAKSLIGIWGSI